MRAALRMQLRLISMLVFLATTLISRAQLALNPGDVWTYSFTDLPYRTSCFCQGTAYGSVSVSMSAFANGSTLKYEAISSDYADSSATGVVTSGSFQITRNHMYDTYGGGPIHGLFRLTMLTGSCIITDVTVDVVRPSALTYLDYYRGSASLTSPPPRLMVRSVATNRAEVSWWMNGAAGYVLQSTNALRSGVWPQAPQTPYIVSNRFVVTVEQPGQAYFRLRK